MLLVGMFSLFSLVSITNGIASEATEEQKATTQEANQEANAKNATTDKANKRKRAKTTPSHETKPQKTSSPPPTYIDPITGMEFVYIPAGEFMMGSEKNVNTRPVHRVRISSFYMGKYEVTQEEWQKVMGGKALDEKMKRLPAGNVSWDDAQSFIKKLNALTGKHYRLPTEAEWEYAARAGSTEESPWGEDNRKACRYANIADLTLHKAFLESEKDRIPQNELEDTAGFFVCEDGFADAAPVGSFLSNAFGLYDMIGNVAEWSSDYYLDHYKDIPVAHNPEGPARSEINPYYLKPPFKEDDIHVVRGVSWHSGVSEAWFARRSGGFPSIIMEGMGLRLVLEK